VSVLSGIHLQTRPHERLFLAGLSFGIDTGSTKKLVVERRSSGDPSTGVPRGDARARRLPIFETAAVVSAG
jgi:hypothetical protein